MIEDILVETLGCERDAIRDDLALNEIPAWDSMTHMILITRIEGEHGIQMTGDEIAGLETVGGIREVLRNHGVEA